MNKLNLPEGGNSIIYQKSRNYPKGLFDLSSPPEALYCIGDTKLLELDFLAIIGPRKATEYSLECTRRFAGYTGQCGYAVLSGGAQGTDEAAHLAAMASGCRTVAVVPNLSYRKEFYQKIVDNGGLLISPYKFEQEGIMSSMFHYRNRVIAAMSRAVLLCGAAMPSGTMSTALSAQSLGRRVLVVPGQIDDPAFAGSNRLIGNPAHVVCTEEQLQTQLICADLS